MNLQSLHSLQARIRDCTKEGDRDLDCEIANLHGWRQDADYNYTPSGAMTLDEPSRYTSDPEGLGACVALMREVLPGCEWHKITGDAFAIWEPLPLRPRLLASNFKLANDCLTFLDAIVSALIAQLD